MGFVLQISSVLFLLFVFPVFILVVGYAPPCCDSALLFVKQPICELIYLGCHARLFPVKSSVQ